VIISYIKIKEIRLIKKKKKKDRKKKKKEEEEIRKI
jgi:hypothetical protein